MLSRTPLALIDSNRRFKEKLTPNNRRKIEGAIAANATYTFAAENVNCYYGIIRIILSSLIRNIINNKLIYSVINQNVT